MIQSALEYHRVTSYQRHDMQPHFLDWANTPQTYKTYPDLPSYALDSTESCPQKSLWNLLESKAEQNRDSQFDIKNLSDLLLLSYTLTAKRQMGSQTMYYRSVPSAGALYPTELYVCSHDIDGLDPGVYYYDIYGFSLKQLRSAYIEPFTVAGQDASLNDEVAATILLSGIFFRSSWKYRTRAFRYVSLDTGHLLENIGLALNLLALPHAITYAFDDGHQNHLIGVDGKREACFVGIQIYGQTEKRQPKDRTPRDLVTLDRGLLDASRVSAAERDNETIVAMYQLGSTMQAQLTDPRLAQVMAPEYLDSFSITIRPSSDPILPHAETVLKRRSIRAYESNLYPRHRLMQLLTLLCRPITTETRPDTADESNIAIGFLANNVADIKPGYYLLEQAEKSCHLVKAGNLIPQMAAVCLDQDWLRHAPLHFLFMTNLEQLDRRLGPRGYRYSMINAGRMGQRLYLGATAMGDGCCGIGALYDQEAKDLLGLNEGSYLLYLVAVGSPAIGSRQ
jgi:SagB-type dehydrogenase family enzyme